MSTKKVIVSLSFLICFSANMLGQYSIDQQLSKAQMYIDSNEIKVAEEIINNIEKKITTDDKLAIAKLNYLKGTALYYQDELAKAIIFLEKSISFWKKHPNNSIFSANAYRITGHCLTDLEQYDAGLNYYQKSLEIEKKNKLAVKRLVDMYYYIGLNRQSKKLLVQSNIFFQRGVEIVKNKYSLY